MPETPLERDVKRGLTRRAERIAIPLGEPSKLLPSTAPDLFSNDYLSLSDNPELRKSFLSSASRQSQLFGSTGARLLTGNSTAHINLELRLQKFFDAPSALLFSSGYDANVAFFGAMPGPRDVLIMDELIHASAQDGIAVSRLDKGSCYSFRHNSVPSFETCLSYVLDRHPQIKQGKTTLFIAVESLYSMDGDFCPLLEILGAAEARVPREALHVVVDEAHATGLFGRYGRGYISFLGAERRVHSIIHTFGKARAFHGGESISQIYSVRVFDKRFYSCNSDKSSFKVAPRQFWSSVHLHHLNSVLTCSRSKLFF